MDISKVFDLASSIVLKKCLHIIKIPVKSINIVMDMTYNRFSKVNNITAIILSVCE